MDYVCDKNKNMKPVRCLDRIWWRNLSIDHNLFLITKNIQKKDETNLEQKKYCFYYKCKCCTLYIFKKLQHQTSI